MQKRRHDPASSTNRRPHVPLLKKRKCAEIEEDLGHRGQAPRRHAPPRQQAVEQRNVAASPQRQNLDPEQHISTVERKNIPELSPKLADLVEKLVNDYRLGMIQLRGNNKVQSEAAGAAWQKNAAEANWRIILHKSGTEESDNPNQNSDEIRRTRGFDLMNRIVDSLLPKIGAYALTVYASYHARNLCFMSIYRSLAAEDVETVANGVVTQLESFKFLAADVNISIMVPLALVSWKMKTPYAVVCQTLGLSRLAELDFPVCKRLDAIEALRPLLKRLAWTDELEKYRALTFERLEVELSTSCEVSLSHLLLKNRRVMPPAHDDDMEAYGALPTSVTQPASFPKASRANFRSSCYPFIVANSTKIADDSACPAAVPACSSTDFKGQLRNECDTPPTAPFSIHRQANEGNNPDGQTYLMSVSQEHVDSLALGTSSYLPWLCLSASEEPLTGIADYPMPTQSVKATLPSQSPPMANGLQPLARSPSLPHGLHVVEDLLHTTRMYFESICQSMTFDRHGILLSRDGTILNNNLCNDFDSYCFTAAMLFGRGSPNEASHALSKACALVKQIMKTQHPRTLACLFEVFIHLLQSGLPRIANLLRDFVQKMSAVVIEPSQPWGKICRLLAELDSDFLQEPMAQAWRCSVDTFDSKLGMSSRLAVSVRLDYVKRVYGATDIHEEERILRGLRKSLTASNLSTPRIMLNLAHNLNRQRQHEDAEGLAREVLSLCRQYDRSVEYDRTVETIECLKIIAHSQFSQGKSEAEQTLREAIRMIETRWGTQHSWFLEFMNVLQSWLVDWGRGEDANRILKHIEMLSCDVSDEQLGSV